MKKIKIVWSLIFLLLVIISIANFLIIKYENNKYLKDDYMNIVNNLKYKLKKSNNILVELRDELNESKIEIDKKQNIINNLMQLNRENVETKRNYIRFYNHMYDIGCIDKPGEPLGIVKRVLKNINS